MVTIYHVHYKAILFVSNRNYHVFYYLLAGASEEERLAFHLKQPEEYHYLNQVRVMKYILKCRALLNFTS